MDQALGWYEKAVDEHDPNSKYIRLSIGGVVAEDNPRFQAILRRIGIPKRSTRQPKRCKSRQRTV